MTALAPTPRVRSVDPTTYAPFNGFSCGGSSHYEADVDQLVAALHLGNLPWEVVRVAESPNVDDLMGLCVVQARPLLPDAADAAYVGLISVAAGWRGHRLADGSRLGSLLLGDALEQIMCIWNGPPMPVVWALVAPSNAASHNTFAHWGFDRIETGASYEVRYRPAGLGLTSSR